MAVSPISETRCRFNGMHLWLHPSTNADDWLVGLSEFAQDQYSDITYIELPPTGQFFRRNTTNLLLESVKTAIELTMPVSGEITRVNSQLHNEPQLVNQSPHGDGWLYALKPSDLHELDDLMSFTDYDVWLDQ